MNKCKFILEDGKCVCSQCGIKIPNNNCNIIRICKPVTLVEKLQNLNKTGEEWAAKGNPVPNEEEVQRRLTICKACPLFSNGTCTLCTCNMNYKARLATAHCPDNPPKW